MEDIRTGFGAERRLLIKYGYGTGITEVEAKAQILDALLSHTPLELKDYNFIDRETKELAVWYYLE